MPPLGDPGKSPGRGGGAPKGQSRAGRGGLGGLSKGAGGPGKAKNAEEEYIFSFCHFANKQLSELLQGDPTKSAKEAQLRKRIEELVKPLKSGGSGKSIVGDVISFLKELTPKAQNIDFLGKFNQAAQQAKMQVGKQTKGDALKRVAGSAMQSDTAKKAKIDPNVKPPGAAADAARKAQQGQAAAGSKGAEPKEGGQTNAPTAAKPPTGSASPAKAGKVDAKKPEQKKAQNDDDILDVVKSAGIDVEGEEQLLALDAVGQEEALESIVKESEILSQNVLKQKLESLASRYGLDAVSRECLEFLSLAVRERLSNFMDMYLQARKVQVEEDKSSWPTGQVIASEMNARELLMSSNNASFATDENPRKGVALRNCLFVVDHCDPETVLLAQSIRWFSRLHEVGEGKGR